MISKKLSGVGYGLVMATTCVLTYYCTLIGLSLFYLGSSLYPTLPWTDCDHLVAIPLLYMMMMTMLMTMMMTVKMMVTNQVGIPKDKVCLPSKPVLEAKNLTRYAPYLSDNLHSSPNSCKDYYMTERNHVLRTHLYCP